MRSKQQWTEEDNAKLKSLAGKKQPVLIAAGLRRTTRAVVQQAWKLQVSLEIRPAGDQLAVQNSTFKSDQA